MKRMFWRTVLPALLAVALFSGVVFLYLLPSLDRVVMDQKRLMISELTESAWNILARYEAEEDAGRLTREEAMDEAVEQVRSLHYGRGSKDYFWILDGHPRMVVHPWRPDLEGSDLSDFEDPEGTRVFVEMARVVERDGAGYVRYMWQWKDDPERVVPKLSYVKGFAPWGWIIGTGVYTEDVDVEVGAITSNLRTAAWLIVAAVSALLYALLRASFQAERGRLRATAALQASEEKYRSLVESAGEAILMSLAGEGLYANASLLKLLGYARSELDGLDPDALIRPSEEEAAAGRRHWEAVRDGDAAPARYEAELVRRDGRGLRVMLTLSRIVVQGRTGFMAVATRLSQPRELDVRTATSVDDLEAASRRTRDLATMMMNHGADGRAVGEMLSAGADGVVRKAVEFLLPELGPPPVAFDFLLMGSLGRAEVSLLADQDHAIVHADVPPSEALVVRDYFLKVGRRVSEALDSAGYPYCEGGIMASLPECCRSLGEWRETFDGWIGAMEAEDLLRAKIHFDFRGVLDEGFLVPSLRAHLGGAVASNPRFIPLLARNILLFEPPLNAFGGFVLEETDDTREVFDVKGVQAQVVDIVRLRALQHGIGAASTRERLAELTEAGHLKPETAASLSAAFSQLQSTRLRHQARRRADRLVVDNRVDPSLLDPAEQEALKETFRSVKALQEALQHEFGGPS